MADRCIPANPDISGIGVRAAIYAQNLLCFAPVVAHLWDGVVSADEMKGVKDQSIGMLSIAFAILISTIIQAKVTTSTSLITNFHAAIVLDLSWMNNTSTFIWFLLYAHHRSKASSKNDVIPATWRDWTKALLSPVNRLVTGKGKASHNQDEKFADSQKGVVGDSEGSDGERASIHSSGQRNDSKSGIDDEKRHGSYTERLFPALIQRLWHLISQAPVLTLGSIHLSLMASVGIWLWSDPSKFGFPVPCDPSLVIIGSAVRFSSPALRICSLLIYSLLLIPGVNLLLPFLFFLMLHILYNMSWSRHPRFWSQYRRIMHAIRRSPRTLWQIPETLRQMPDNVLRRQCASPSDEERQISGNHCAIVQPSHRSSITSLPLQPIRSAGSNVQNHNGHHQTPPQTQAIHPLPSLSSASLSPPSSDSHTAFLVVGLICLAIINIIFLVDIELTLSRNRQNQSREEDNWGFGQILALLLLLVPLRDFVTSINDVQRKLREKEEQAKKARRMVQKRFEEKLLKAISEDILDDDYFRYLIGQGADPNTKLSGRSKFVTLLQFATYKGNKALVKYLLEKEVDSNIEGEECGTAMHVAARTQHLDIAFLLDEKRGNTNILVELRKEIHMTISYLLKFLKNSDSNVRYAALEGLSKLSQLEIH